MTISYEYIPAGSETPVKALYSGNHTVGGLDTVHIARWPCQDTGGPRADIVILEPNQNIRFATGTNATAPHGIQLNTIKDIFNLHANVQTVSLRGVTASALAVARVSWVVVR